MVIGRNIRLYRELKDYTQSYVADVLGMSQQAYSKLEKKGGDISINLLRRIAEVLNVDETVLLHPNMNDLVNFKLPEQAEREAYYLSNSEKEFYEKLIVEKDKRIEELTEVISILKNR